MRIAVPRTRRRTLRATSFIRWAGGKTSLLPKLTARLPDVSERYFEPMVGSGALFFSGHPAGVGHDDLT